MARINIKKRNARRHAMQVLYQWDFVEGPSTDLLAEFLAQNTLEKTDTEYLQEIVRAVIKDINVIDGLLAHGLDREVHELNPVELAILRLATYELQYRLEIPYRVVINEAIELGKEFGSEDGFKYVNGVLDTLAKQLGRNSI